MITHLASRVAKLEAAPHAAGRLLTTFARDHADADRQVEELRRTGELGPHDTLLIAMWLSPKEAGAND